MIAWQNRLTPAEGLNASAMLQNRGEFVLILATLAVGAGLDPRLTPFAGLYVLIMAIIGPVLAVNSERLGAVLFRSKRKKSVVLERDVSRVEGIALLEAVAAGQLPATEEDDEGDAGLFDPIVAMETAPHESKDPHSQQAEKQSDELSDRKRDPEY
jgi:CPA2 family monovalent cation:H+ antiporter-2